MGENSHIAWTDDTFNPWIGCMKVSPGCTNCYAETQQARWGHADRWGPNSVRSVTSDANWKKPLKWNAEAERAGVRRRVFCGSLCDVFEDHETANATRPRLWQLIADTPWLDWLLLTKRTGNIAPNLPSSWGAGWPNVWLGTSVENLKYAGERLPELVRIPAMVRFVSAEPLVGSLHGVDWVGIDWVIVGGESGPGFRPMPLEWVREIQFSATESGATFFFKQSAGPRPGEGTTLDGRTWQAWPTPRR